MKLLTSFIHTVSIRKNLQLAIPNSAIPVAADIMKSNQASASPNQNSFSHSTSTTSSSSLSYRTAMSSSCSENKTQTKKGERNSKSDADTHTPTSSSDKGSLLMIILPKEWRDFNVNKDDTNRIDPHPLANTLSDCDKYGNDNIKPKVQDHDESSSSNLEFNFDTIVDTTTVDPLDLIVSLDLHLNLSLYDKEEIMKVHMNREGIEMADRTFKRLEISATKKISSVQMKGKGKDKAKNKKRKKGKGMNPSVTSRLYTRASVGVGDSDGSEDAGKRNVNAEEFNAVQLCTKLALLHQAKDYTSKSIGLELSIPNPDNNDTALTTSSIADPQLSSSNSTCTCTNLDLHVTSNPPTILGVQTFEFFSSKIFSKVPIVIQTQLVHATRAEVSWFVDDNLVLHDSHSFIPQSHHIGKTLSVLIKPYREGYHGECFHEAYKFENIIEDLPYMPIISPLRDEFIAERSPQEKKNTIRMLTYNILADLYVSREVDDGSVTYPHVKQEHVQKTRRIPMIVAEILTHDPDVLCLQEVDGSVYDTYLQPAFQAMNFDGYYSNKASCQREGCALFWKRALFEANADELLTFSLRDLFGSELELDEKSRPTDDEQWKSMEGIKRLLNTHKELRKVTMEKIGQVAQIATLKLKNPREDQPDKIVVTNTHLFYHPMADHIRAMQVYVVCKKIDEIRKSKSDTTGACNSYPFMLCGDLNSDPLSGAAQLLFTRSVQSDHHDCWKHLHEYQWDMGETEYMVEHEYVGNKVGSSDYKYEEEQFQNAVQDVSALSKPSAPDIELPGSFPILVSGCKEMPKFTNYAVDFVDTLDYILGSQCSSNEQYGFAAKRSAMMPTAEEVKQFVAMVSAFISY